MGQDDKKDGQEQPEGYQDQNEQGARESRGDSTPSEPLTSDTGSRTDTKKSDAEDLDELDDDRDEDSRDGGTNRRRSIN